MSFAEYVQGQGLASAELPLIHTTDCFRLSSIQTSNKIQATACSIFKESLLYFFYGRPAYRDSSATNPARDIALYPICFVFRPGTISTKSHRLYPFDTGAFQKGLYEPAIAPGQALVAYELEGTIENARRIVDGFFGINENYLSNTPRDGLTFGSTEVEASLYYQLINGGGSVDCDDRCSAIEVQVAEDLRLSDGILVAVVLPTCFLDNPALREAMLKVWRAQPLTYDAVVGMRPLEFHGTVRQLVRDFFRRMSLI